MSVLNGGPSGQVAWRELIVGVLNQGTYERICEPGTQAMWHIYTPVGDCVADVNLTSTVRCTWFQMFRNLTRQAFLYESSMNYTSCLQLWAPLLYIYVYELLAEISRLQLNTRRLTARFNVPHARLALTSSRECLPTWSGQSLREGPKC